MNFAAVTASREMSPEGLSGGWLEERARLIPAHQICHCLSLNQSRISRAVSDFRAGGSGERTRHRVLTLAPRQRCLSENSLRRGRRNPAREGARAPQTWPTGPRLQEDGIDAEAGGEVFAGGNLLNAFFVLERALLVVVGQAPAGLDAEKRTTIGPQGQVRYAGKIDRNGPSARRVGEGEGAVRDVDQFQNVRSGQFLLRKRHLAAGELNIFCFAAEIIRGREMTPVKAGGHLEAEGVERSRGKSRVQTKTDMRRQFRFVVSKLERNGNTRAIEAIRQMEQHLEWILRR